jgi:putative DNA primase/helicase
MTDKKSGAGPSTDGEGTPNIIPFKDKRKGNWKNELYRTGGPSSKIKRVVANGMVALRHAPEWQGSLRFDELSQAILIGRQPPDPWPQEIKYQPRPWNEQDDSLFSEWLTRQGIDLSSCGASEAALTVARESPFHPIRDYLNSLVWDGKPRVSTWLFDYLGASSVGEVKDYHSAIGKKWLISGIARIMNPGCQVDHVLIFEGLQGNGKSSLLRELCHQESWFSDQSPDLNDSRDASMSLEGKWIIELAELEAFKGVNHERLKAFISRRTDHIRRPWGKRFIDVPRQSIFAGSTNRDDYFNDETGNRRYWPFQATKLDIAGVRAARDQLWAEAYTLYKDKTPHWLDTQELRKLAAEAQDRRFETDPWEEEIEAHVSGLEEVRTKELLVKILGGDRELTKGDQMRVAKILRHLGFKRDERRDEKGKKIRFFKRMPVELNLPTSPPSPT